MAVEFKTTPFNDYEAFSRSAINMLAKDRMATFQELAEEAFRDLLRKHNRPVGLKASLRQSLGGSENVVPLKKPRNRKRT